MKIEITELVLEQMINGVEDFPHSGFFKVHQKAVKTEDLVYANKKTHFWLFLEPWAAASAEIHPDTEEQQEELQTTNPIGFVNENVLLKTIAMLANKERLGDLID